MHELEFRSDYAHSQQGLLEIGSLIRDIFDVEISSLDRLGHDPSIVAFGWWQDTRLVANVSLYERQLWLCGQQVSAFGVQSVATRPEWRKRGLFSDLMKRALEYADKRSNLVILSTDTPDLYEGFGFRQITETRFRSKFSPRGATPACRQLSLDNDSDLALLKRAFGKRAPTSLLASACDHPALFLLKAKLTPEISLLYLPDFDAVIAIMQDTSCLSIIDIVAPVIPSIDEIVRAIGFSGGELEVLLTPDRLSWLPEKTETVDNGYMVRGAFAPEGQAFMLSDMRV